jgi:hypothetical protein
LEKAVVTNDTIRFNDTLVIKSGDSMIRVFSRGRYLGYASRESSINRLRKTVSYPLEIDDIDAEQDYGRMLFSRECIVCHNVNEISPAHYDKIKTKDKPTEIRLDGVNYLFITRDNKHWYLSRFTSEQERSLKRYLSKAR